MSKTVCVFCGASNAAPQDHLQMGWDLGVNLANNGHKLVYGGGDCGMMGKVANGVLSAGGWVTGVFPENLKEFEQEHESLSENIIVDSMHTRKDLMYKKSDAFIVLPGGIGTLEEAVEMLSWARLGLHAKPMAFLDEDGFWAPFFELMDHIIDGKFTPEEFRAALVHEQTPEGAIQALCDRVVVLGD